MGKVIKNKNEYVLESDYMIHKVDLSTPEDEHLHRFVEIVYTLGGKGLHRIDGKEYYVKAGDLLVINYRSYHSIVPIEDLSYVDIMLKPEYVNEALKDTEDLFLILKLRDFSDLSNSVIRDNVFLHFDHDERKTFEFLLSITEKEQKNTFSACQTMIYSALSMILTLIFRKMSKTRNERLEINEHLLDYIKRNCQMRLSVSDMASMCGYTAEHFSRIFKSYTGKSPKEYILDARIEQAKRLLKKTDKSIELVIEECGFSNRTEFFKKFFEKMQITPLQYRKNQK